jgi:LemA protein
MTLIQWTLSVVGVFAMVWVLTTYNHLVRRRNDISNAFAQIDVQLKRRHDLIANLVEVARKYVSHERETLEAVARARTMIRTAADAVKSEPADAHRLSVLAKAESVLEGHMGRLMAVVESYPDLKADRTLRELSEEMTHTENRIAFARQAFNDAVLEYNNTKQAAPQVFVARLGGFRDGAMLAATSNAAERAAVRVRL